MLPQALPVPGRAQGCQAGQAKGCLVCESCGANMRAASLQNRFQLLLMHPAREVWACRGFRQQVQEVPSGPGTSCGGVEGRDVKIWVRGCWTQELKCAEMHLHTHSLSRVLLHTANI